MKDEPLKFRSNEDNTPVQFTTDDVQDLGEAIKSVSHIRSNFISDYEQGNITPELLAKLEANLEHIFTFFNLQDAKEQDRLENQQRAEMKRYENEQLRSLLNKPVTNEDVRERLKLLDNELNVWWDVVGTGFLKINYLANAVRLELSGYVSDGYDMEGNKVREKEKIEILKAKGFQFSEDKDKDLLLNENNIKLFNSLVKETFPKANVWSVDNMKYGNDFKIKDVEVTMPYSSLDDFEFSVQPKYDTSPYNHRNITTEKGRIEKSLSELGFAISTLVDFYNKQDLKVGFSETLLSCMELYAMDLFSIFDYKGIFFKRSEEISGAIRAANLENHDLRAQLGKKVKNSEIGSTIERLTDTLTSWWGKEFGYVSTGDIRFHPYGVEVKMGCRVTSYHGYKADDDGYVSKKEKSQKLHDLGLSLDGENFHDTEQNRAYIKQLLDNRFGYGNYRIDSVNSDWKHIKEITVTIQDLDSI